jgi:mitogen-activated protein kinase 1/3/mitogen-activated protein kinase 6
METDLSSIIKSPQPLSDAHVQFFLYQILRGLKYIHTSNVIHRDLVRVTLTYADLCICPLLTSIVQKPRNLLVNSNCDLKICDFGLARVDFAEMQWKVAAMTDYVATRWYRAPEVILSWKKYTKAIDMWSVGCILAELIGRKPIFPGTDSQHQLSLITEILGTPSEHTVANIKQEKALSFLRQLPECEPVDLADLYPDASPDSLGQYHITHTHTPVQQKARVWHGAP